MELELIDFLLENNFQDEKEEIIISKRIPKPFEIKPLSNTKYGEITRLCRKVTRKGTEIDFEKLKVKVCVEGTIYPNFSDAGSISKAQVNLPDQLVQKLLKPGEIDVLYTKIATLSGFDTNLEEAIEEAKN